MSDYEELVEQAFREGLSVTENVHFESRVNGLIVGKKIALSENLLTDRERFCVLAEEIGHHFVNSGDIIKDPYQEQKAHRYAIDLVLSVDMVINAVIELGEEATMPAVAGELGVTEKFLEESLELYSKRFEGKVKYRGYTITFNPRLHIDTE